MAQEAWEPGNTAGFGSQALSQPQALPLVVPVTQNTVLIDSRMCRAPAKVSSASTPALAPGGDDPGNLIGQPLKNSAEKLVSREILESVPEASRVISGCTTE